MKLLKVPIFKNNDYIFHSLNVVVYISLFFLLKSLTLDVGSYPSNGYSIAWHAWIIPVAAVCIFLLLKKYYLSTLNFLLLMFFFLNRTFLLKVILHIVFLFLEIYVFIKIDKSYATNGGFERTSSLIFIIGQIYLYVQIIYELREKWIDSNKI